MRKRIFILVIIILIGNQYSNLFGQDVATQQQRVKKYPIDFAIGNISVGRPFSDIFINRSYPLATFGTACYFLDEKNSQIYQTLKVGGYYNKNHTSALLVNTEIGYRYTLNFGLFADANLGMGYSHLFKSHAIDKTGSNKEYEQAREWDTPSLMVNYSLSIGYDFENQSQIPVSVFVRYGNYAQLSFNPLIALPQNCLLIGTRFLINCKQKSK